MYTTQSGELQRVRLGVTSLVGCARRRDGRPREVSDLKLYLFNNKRVVLGVFSVRMPQGQAQNSWDSEASMQGDLSIV